LKLAVVEAFRGAGISKSEFARRIGNAETEAYRVLDPDHATKLASLETALPVLGKEVVVSVKDAA
jgi:antitoxin HicB